MERIRRTGFGLIALLMLGGVATVAAADPVAPQSSVDSVSDLDSGAAHWNYIAPHAAPPSANAVTDVAKVTAAPARQPAPNNPGERQLDDHLSVETAQPTQPAKATTPWYAAPAH